jgi:hypothetical protein
VLDDGKKLKNIVYDVNKARETDVLKSFEEAQMKVVKVSCWFLDSHICYLDIPSLSVL